MIVLIVIDLILCSIALTLDASTITAHTIGFVVCTVLLLNQRTHRLGLPALGVLAAAGVTYAIRGAALALLLKSGIPQFAALAAVVVGSRNLQAAVTDRVLDHAAYRTEATACAGALTVFFVLALLRLMYIGLAELIPEEAYYWQYANHLDYGYLDHPPMIAWMIAAGTEIFGTNEFGVRIAPYLCSLLAALFLYRLALHLYGRTIAAYSVAIFSVLPYTFFNGFLATPDAPLLVCWIAGTFYLYRALVEGHSRSWLYFGAALGAGMLSKYTIALLPLSALAFMVFETEARRRLSDAGPYVALLFAFAVFSPVVFWNYQHAWASFAFQSSRRLGSPTEFGLHLIALNALSLIGPFGLAAVVLCWKDALRARLKLFPSVLAARFLL